MQEITPGVQTKVQQLVAELGDLFFVEDITTDFSEPGAVRFRGRLQVPVDEATSKLRMRWLDHNLMPVIRQVEGQDVVVALPLAGRTVTPAVRVGRPWVNLVLFLATVVTVLFAGGQMSGFDPSGGDWVGFLLSGWPFAAGLLVTLVTHEFGHYFAAQYHGVAATLPYFIPMPLSVLGTFGAVINIKTPMRDRRALLDIGAAGPLAGLVVALPVLIVGLALSPVQPLDGQCTADQPCLMEGNSLLYLGSKLLVFGRVLPSEGEDVMLHPLAFAGWAGVLVTALNLLPVGTLDGGHVANALLGKKARFLYFPVLLTLVALGFLWEGWWLWAVMMLFFGRMNARPLDDVTPLDARRQVVAVVTLLVFVLTFTPLPMTIIP